MKYIISFLIIILAAGAAVGLYSSSPRTKKAVPKRPVPLVETVKLHPGKENVFIEAFGTVVPARSITLQSEVEGRIISQNPELIPGGLINMDEMLVQVDPADYELVVHEYRAEVEEANFELDLEKGKQVIAGREWTLMEKEIKTAEAGKSLALREPHLRLAKAKVDKAKSRLAMAELALKRTTVKAPFNALVLEEFIDKGQLVNKQTALATIVGADQFRVQASVPVSVLQRISIPKETGQRGPSAKIIFEPVNGPPVIRSGHVLRIMGNLDPEGRMARLLIAINDPLDLHSGNASDRTKGKVLLGSYVKVMINAGSFNNVYTIPRHALREGDLIWVKDSDDTLQTRQADVVWRRKDDVLAIIELNPGEELILSRLQSPLPGIKVKARGQGGKDSRVQVKKP
jgi:RND family efflux transporter MFP subunit